MCKLDSAKTKQNKYNTVTQHTIHKQHKTQEHEFSSLMSLKDFISLQNMSMSQHNKFSAAAHLAEELFLHVAKNGL